MVEYIHQDQLVFDVVVEIEMIQNQYFVLVVDLDSVDQDLEKDRLNFVIINFH